MLKIKIQSIFDRKHPNVLLYGFLNSFQAILAFFKQILTVFNIPITKNDREFVNPTGSSVEVDDHSYSSLLWGTCFSQILAILELKPKFC